MKNLNRVLMGSSLVSDLFAQHWMRINCDAFTPSEVIRGSRQFVKARILLLLSILLLLDSVMLLVLNRPALFTAALGIMGIGGCVYAIRQMKAYAAKYLTGQEFVQDIESLSIGIGVKLQGLTFDEVRGLAEKVLREQACARITSGPGSELSSSSEDSGRQKPRAEAWMVTCKFNLIFPVFERFGFVTTEHKTRYITRVIAHCASPRMAQATPM